MAAYDLIVIGGGINGLGIAADATARGISTLVVEKRDFGCGTTAASSRLIHGGLRYLEHADFRLVRESLRERGLLARQWPHLIRPIRLLLPSYEGQRPGALLIGAGLRMYDLIARDPLFPPTRRLSHDQVSGVEPGLSHRGLKVAFIYGDGQLAYPERLCMELLRVVHDAGGRAQNHTRVVGLNIRAGRAVGASLRDELTGAESVAEAPIIVNAAGPWVDCVNQLLPRPPEPLIAGTWGTHIVLPRRPDGPRGALYTLTMSDGRPFFVLPWEERVLVGTTDVPFSGDPDHLRAQDWEIGYLLDETNRLFPGAAYGCQDVAYTTIGIRPLPAARPAQKQRAGAITRRHFLVDHGQEDGIDGLFSLVGGKLTTFRSLAECTVDTVLRKLGRPEIPCTTRATPDPLEDMALQQRAQAEGVDLALSAEQVNRLVRLYGRRCVEIMTLLRERPDLNEPVAPGSQALAAEVTHAVEYEAARTVDDVLRRRLMRLPPTPEELVATAAMLTEQAGTNLARLRGESHCG